MQKMTNRVEKCCKLETYNLFSSNSILFFLQPRAQSVSMKTETWTTSNTNNIWLHMLSFLFSRFVVPFFVTLKFRSAVFFVCFKKKKGVRRVSMFTIFSLMNF